MKESLDAYRLGAMGALLDEYEKALEELKVLLSKSNQDNFVMVVDPDTEDPNCRSLQTIMSHVIGAGIGYSNYIRERASIPITGKRPEIMHIDEVNKELDQMFNYFEETVNNLGEISGGFWEKFLMRVGWEVNYDLEQLIEHAIVHILRHRRQVEKFLIQLNYE